MGVEPLRNKLQSVVGGTVARFLGELGYYDEVELAFDSEPVLAAGMRVAQTIRAAQGLHTVLQPSKETASSAFQCSATFRTALLLMISVGETATMSISMLSFVNQIPLLH